MYEKTSMEKTSMEVTYVARPAKAIKLQHELSAVIVDDRPIGSLGHHIYTVIVEKQEDIRKLTESQAYPLYFTLNASEVESEKFYLMLETLKAILKKRLSVRDVNFDTIAFEEGYHVYPIVTTMPVSYLFLSNAEYNYIFRDFTLDAIYGKMLVSPSDLALQVVEKSQSFFNVSSQFGIVLASALMQDYLTLPEIKHRKEEVEYEVAQLQNEYSISAMPHTSQEFDGLVTELAHVWNFRSKPGSVSSQPQFAKPEVKREDPKLRSRVHSKHASTGEQEAVRENVFMRHHVVGDFATWVKTAIVEIIHDRPIPITVKVDNVTNLPQKIKEGFRKAIDNNQFLSGVDAPVLRGQHVTMFVYTPEDVHNILSATRGVAPSRQDVFEIAVREDNGQTYVVFDQHGKTVAVPPEFDASNWQDALTPWGKVMTFLRKYPSERMF